MNTGDIKEIQKALKDQHIYADTITPHQRTRDKVNYLLDNHHLLRLSQSPLNEQIKLHNVESVSLAPNVHSSGVLTLSGYTWNYIVIDYIQGYDLWSIAQDLSDEQKVKIGREIASFLNELHLITCETYDIGHYVPAIPRYEGLWKNGQKEYVDILLGDISKMDLNSRSRETIEKAYDYIQTNMDVLDFQKGAKLLHNDFHPKNIIVDEAGKLAGVIDWECSLFGEADFELTNFFEWCIYPYESGRQLEIMLQAIVENLQNIPKLDYLEKRMIIYQLEHELHQLIWNGNVQEGKRAKQIDGW